MKDEIIKKKITENETVMLLIKYLEKENYTIIDYCTGTKKGVDIEAEKNNKKLLIEVKGARANIIKKRKFFDSGQIKVHFGKAIIKSIETKIKHPEDSVAIAHPDDEDIRRNIESLIPYINQIGIIHYWVKRDGSVIKCGN